MYKVEESSFGGYEPQLRHPFNVKWTIKYLFRYTIYQEGRSHFSEPL
jgi:hypothetical protein